MPVADLVRWRNEVESGAVLGPRLVVSGPFVDGPHPIWPGSIKVSTEEDGKQSVDTLKAAGVQISMDGKGRWIDNVFIERVWRSVKYENIYLRAYETGTQLRRGLTAYFDFYNTRRIHQALDYQTPDDVYYVRAQCKLAA